jgi:hypothetical protein
MRSGRVASRGFTLIDVLVSLGVIAVLVSLMLPSLTSVRETGNRVVCSSNVRQSGLGLAMYCDDNRGFLPSSVYLQSRNAAGQDFGFISTGSEMMTLRLEDPTVFSATDAWDGLGRLYRAEYLLAPKVFYCPSHRGEHPFAAYADRWSSDQGEIVSNYHFRGEGPDGVRQIERIDPQTSALVTDGLRTVTDYNHKIGSNVLYADLSVRWFLDAGGSVSQLLRDGGGDGNEGGSYKDIWKTFDSPGGEDQPR